MNPDSCETLAYDASTRMDVSAPMRPIRNLRDLAYYVARQYPEFPRRQVLAMLLFACVAIGESLEAQAANVTPGDQPPRVMLRGFGVFQLRWHNAARWCKLGGGLQDIPARWKARFTFNRPWRKRFQVAAILAPKPT